MNLFRSWWQHLVDGPPPDVSGDGPDALGTKTIVVLMDGTLSSLKPGCETTIGLIYKLLRRVAGPGLRIHYQQGIQMTDVRSGLDVLTGRGTNRKIQAAYGALANWYEPGDRIFLLGFSRGAYAVRSLAGVMQHVGLVRDTHANTRNIRQAYRHYRDGPHALAAQNFRAAYCHDSVPVDAIGVFDTVKALGVRLPIVWRAFDHRHSFHTAGLGQDTKAGFHALAADETRVAYAPVKWVSDPTWHGTMVQMWFAGSHGDVGGHLAGRENVRPLSNIALVWMLDRLADQGLPLPHGWRDAFPTDVFAPASGAWIGRKKFFLSRKRRVMLRDASEQLHPSLVARRDASPVK